MDSVSNTRQRMPRFAIGLEGPGISARGDGNDESGDGGDDMMTTVIAIVVMI